MKPARLRPLAAEDLIEVTRWYAEQGGGGLGERVFDAAVAGLGPIQARPGQGSQRLGALAGIPIDVVRLLGERQDIAAILNLT